MDNDLNKIAGYEKAIKKKYGPEAVENPAKYWNEDKEKDYLDQLRHVVEKQRRANETSELVEVEGFLVNKKLLSKESNRVCPVCDTYSFKAKDDVYMNKHECCFDCYINYVEGREERWLSGWRPKGD